MRIDIPTFHQHVNQTEQASQSRKFIPLPEAPGNASPVPWLTSIHATENRGPYGDSRYRGNCSGYLIKDLLQYFEPTKVLDPMSGSGTCKDVCQDMDIPCHSFDLRLGHDATNAATYAPLGEFDFVWMHPPYWRMIQYNDDPRCLSSAPSLNEFASRLGTVITNCSDVLTEDGHIAILIGGYSDRGRYIPLASLTTQLAIEAGLWPSCTEIIRLQYGNTSSRRSYRSSFIPGLHDTCMVFQKKRR